MGGVEPECILIIISYGLMDIEKKGTYCKLYALTGAGINLELEVRDQRRR